MGGSNSRRNIEVAMSLRKTPMHVLETKVMTTLYAVVVLVIEFAIWLQIGGLGHAARCSRTL